MYINMILKFICFVSILSIFVSYDIKDDPKYYFCGGRIFASDNRIAVGEINDMCIRISNDYRFLINIQKDINVLQTGENLDNYYTRDSEEFFDRQCRKINNSICDYGFMISVYTIGRKVRITAGKISKNVVTVPTRNSIINDIKNLLSRERYVEGVIRSIDLLISYSYYNPQPNYNSNPTYIPPQNPKPSSSSSTGLWIFVIFIICPIICCCIYFALKKTSHYKEDNAEDVHNHLNKLEHLLKEIRRNSPPVVSIHQCLICMEKIHMHNSQGNQPNLNTFSTTNNDNLPQNNMYSNLLSQDNQHTRFLCGHVYHGMCLQECQLHYCIMCSGNIQASQVIQNTHAFQVIDESHIKNLIRNLHLIYDRRCLEEYSRTYPNQFDSYNTTLALGLVGVWGITAIATTAIMMNDFGDNNYHNNYYDSGTNYNQGGYNSQNINYEPDTAEGDF